jgi:L-ascorbate metabolism protein UlaG (beta-lactamase superfamily)
VRAKAAFAAALFAAMAAFQPAADAACRPQSLVRDVPRPLIRRAAFMAGAGRSPVGTVWVWAPFAAGAASGGGVTIEWFGHNFFRMTSKAGTRIVADPLAPGMYPTPAVNAHAVTIGREHRNHNAVEILRGDPIILRGLTESGAEWRPVVTRVREVEVRGIPIHQISPGGGPMKGAAFTYEIGGLCVAHLGDAGGKLTTRQLRELGVVDVLMIPIGGRFSMGPEMAQVVLRQIKPRVAIPMHYWSREDLLGVFLEGLRHRRHNGSVIRFARETLPQAMTVVVLRSPGGANRPVSPALPFR